MSEFTQDQVFGKVLDHHGLVAAAIDQLGMVDKIDKWLPLSKEKGSKVSMGRRVAAMILNGLGFMDTRLYMFPEFLENKPIERLLGPGLLAEDFNDDALGRCLDAIHAHGPTKLFSNLAFEIGTEKKLLGKSAHFDTTSLSVHGAYNASDGGDIEESQTQDIQAAEGLPLSEDSKDISQNPDVTYGYSKDHRSDLKQIVMNLATTGASGFPLWFEAHSGNASDKVILHEASERMKSFCKEFGSTSEFIYVADSAMYDSCIKEKGRINWLTRVPERHNAAKELLSLPDQSFVWSPLKNGYRQCVVENRYRDIHQRWCIISSEQACKREVITLDKKIRKENELSSKKLWHLSNEKFKCQIDAKKAAQEFRKTLKYHVLDASIEPVQKHPARGKPKKGVEPETVGYSVKGTLAENRERIEIIRRQKGRFILATNQLNRHDLADDNLLQEYKEQSSTEGGFKFIKGNTFEVSSVYLKKPSRISALMMVMALCLMVYGYAQNLIRKSLVEKNEHVPDQKHQPTNKPTLQRVFRFFEGVQVLKISAPERMQTLVINLSELCKQVIGYFGSKAKVIYGIP